MRYSQAKTTKEFLKSLDVKTKEEILTNIADHYGISREDAFEAVTDKDAECILEYVTNSPLRVIVALLFNEFIRKVSREKAEAGLLRIVPDAKDLGYDDYGRIIRFVSKGRNKREKKCIALYDNRGIISIVQQIDVFRPMRYMLNGQPISNCKTIYSIK